MFLELIVIEIIIMTLIFVSLGNKTLREWKRLKEESLIHIALFFYVIGFVILFFSLLGIFNNFNLGSFSFELRFLFGVIYNLFYLEISIFYLSIFTNSRTYFESYAPILIGFSTIINVIAGLNKLAYDELNIVVHLISLVITIILIFLAIKHINNSKKYIHNDDEMKFLNYITKILIIVPIFLILDLISFLYYINNPSSILKFDEQFLFIIFSLGLVITLLIYFGTLKLANKLKNVDIITLLNTIS